MRPNQGGRSSLGVIPAGRTGVDPTAPLRDSTVRPGDDARRRCPVAPSRPRSRCVTTPPVAALLGDDAGKATRFAGAADSLFERHLVFDYVLDPRAAGARERFEAVA